MLISRRVKGSPQRSSSETWDFITKMVCGASGSAKAEFEKVNGILGALLADEGLAESPLVITGVGARIRIYCLIGDEALEQDGSESDVQGINFNGEWEAYIPVRNDAEKTWVEKSLKVKSKKFKTYDPSEGVTDENPNIGSKSFSIDPEELANL